MKLLKGWQPRAKATRLSGLLCEVAALLMVAGTLSPAVADNDENDGPIEVVEPGRVIFEKSYNELTGEWTNWLAQEPIATNPALDNDGRFCDRNQMGEVWFLAGTFGGGEDPIADRTCKVPAGRRYSSPFSRLYLSLQIF